MPMTGRGMLMTSMDVDPLHEAELNLWYDREHLAERVAIEGFLEARRYVAVEASPKYLCVYSTERFDVLSSPAYRAALAHQTEWSKTNIGRFRGMGRAVARITGSRGQGRGAALGLLRLRVARETRDAARATLVGRLDPGERPGVISCHLLESDPVLSVSLTEPDARDPGAADWYLLVDGSETDAVAAAARDIAGPALDEGAGLIDRGTFRLLWDLAKADL